MGKRRGFLRVSVPVAVLLSVPLAGCAAGFHPSPSASSPSALPSASASAAPTSVTVIAPLGVNLRTSPAISASVVGVVAQGVSLPIVSHTASGGGWWEVKGSSQTGWITANPQYTSTATFQTFQSAGSVPWSVLYQQGWTFAQQGPQEVVFTDPARDTITFATAATVAQLPAAASPGVSRSGVTAVEVYGVTAPLVTYSGAGYRASVKFQAQPVLAFLITAKLPARGGAGTLGQFLETVFFTPAASASP